MKRGVIISGGGRNGAWGAARLRFLDNDYDVLGGTSTGALMGPLAIINDHDTLEEAYTSVSNKDIYNIAPVREDGSFKLFGATKRLFRSFFKKTTTLGESRNLRKLIDQFVQRSDWHMIQSKNKEVIVGACETRYHPSEVYYFSSKEWKFEDFKDWIWASANAPLLFSIMYKNTPELIDAEWIDAGLLEVLPYRPVLESGCTDVDIIVHRHAPKRHKVKRSKIKDIPHSATRYFKAILEHNERDNIQEAIDMAERLGINITIHYMPESISESNALAFNKKEMKRIYDQGHNATVVEFKFR